MPPLPTHLSPAFVVATLLPLLLGIVNYTVQTKKILDRWPLPAKVTPFLVVIGSFLTGDVSFIASQSPFVLNGVSLLMLLVAGLYSMVIGHQVGTAMHHFGAAIHRLRPAPLSTPTTVARKIDPNAITEAPPPP